MSTEPPANDTRPSGYWLWLAVTGVLGGVLSGLFGVGGGIIIVPLLMNLAGMDQRRAAATSLVAILPAAIVGSISYLANGEADILAAVFLAIGGIIGSFLGAQLLKRIPLRWLRWLFIALLVGVAVRMLVVTPVRGIGGIDITVTSAIGLVALGLVIGIASGLFGIGGGVIAVPALIALFGAGELVAKGTSLLMMIPTSASGTVTNIRNRTVDLRAGIVVGIAATICSPIGVWLAFWLSPEVSSVLFAALLLAAAVQQTIRAVRAG